MSTSGADTATASTTASTTASRVSLVIALLLGVAAAVYALRLAFTDPALLVTQAVHAGAALALLLVLAFVGLNLLFRETRTALLVGNGARVSTPIAIGVVDAAVVFDTQNKDLPNYVPIVRSFNRLGGAELSYAFWVFKAANLASNEGATAVTVDAGLTPSDVVLLVKGDPAKIGQTASASASATKYDVLVKAPLIKFDGSTDRLSVEFNTSEPSHVDGLLEGASASGSVAARAAYATKVSVYGLNDPKFNARWFHVAVVLKDSDPTNRLDRNIQARIFVNGESVFDRTVVGNVDLGGHGSSTLRQNNGFLYLLPTLAWTGAANAALKTSGPATRVDKLPTGKLFVDTSGVVVNDPLSPKAATGNPLGVRLANVWHYNYALEDAEVQKLYAQGFTKKAAAVAAAAATANPYPMSEPTAWERVLTA